MNLLMLLHSFLIDPTQAGHIYSKAMPQMALTVVFHSSLSFRSRSSSSSEKAYAVTLKRRGHDLSGEQQWNYTPDACIILKVSVLPKKPDDQ